MFDWVLNTPLYITFNNLHISFFPLEQGCFLDIKLPAQNQTKISVLQFVNDLFICRLFKNFYLNEIGKSQLIYNWKDTVKR